MTVKNNNSDWQTQKCTPLRTFSDSERTFSFSSIFYYFFYKFLFFLLFPTSAIGSRKERPTRCNTPNTLSFIFFLLSALHIPAF